MSQENINTIGAANVVGGQITCPVCGHRVQVVSADEGTNYYEPVEDENNLAIAFRLVRDEKLRHAEERVAVVIAALTDEDEVAHGEAWNPVAATLMGVCAYCNGEWPCHTQRAINRLLVKVRGAQEAPL